METNSAKDRELAYGLIDWMKPGDLLPTQEEVEEFAIALTEARAEGVAQGLEQAAQRCESEAAAFIKIPGMTKASAVCTSMATWIRALIVQPPCDVVPLGDSRSGSKVVKSEECL